VFLLAAAIAACTASVPSESTPKSDSNRDLLLVVNKGDQTLGIVDPESGLQLVTSGGHDRAPIYANSGVASEHTGPSDRMEYRWRLSRRPHQERSKRKLSGNQRS